MDTSHYSFRLMWSPAYIGLVIAMFLYGVEICQFAFYLRSFRCDRPITKFQVYTVAVLDTVHFFLVVASFYRLLVSCHMSTSPSCSYHVPWKEILGIALVYPITFIVQVFYAHRVWIISSQNMILTSAVVISTTVQLLLGLMVTIEVSLTPTLTVLYSTKYFPLSSVASAVCDAIITLSVMYYLRPASIRRESFTNKLLVVFVQMGLFTFINSLVMVILYYIQDRAFGQFLTSAPGIILSKSYVNSMLAVLNARKPIRDQQQQNAQTHSIELSTIPP